MGSGCARRVALPVHLGGQRSFGDGLRDTGAPCRRGGGGGRSCRLPQAGLAYALRLQVEADGGFGYTADGSSPGTNIVASLSAALALPAVK